MRPGVAAAAPVLAASTLPLQALSVSGRGLIREEVHRGLALVRECGSAHVDLTDTWLPIADMTAADVDVLRQVLGSLGLTACGISLVRHSILDPVDGQRNLALTERAIELAAALDVPVVSVGFHEPLSPQARVIPFWAVETPLGARDDPTDLLRRLADHAARLGVAVALELYEGGPLGSGSLAVEMVDRVDRPNVGINMDFGNLYRSPLSTPENWMDCVHTCLPHTIYWHAKNYQRIYEHPSGRFVGSIAASLPTGDIDYRWCIEAAKEADYRGPIVVEHYGGDGIAVQRAGVDYLKGLLRTW